MRRRDVKTVNDVELYYKKCRKIKFKQDIKINSLKDVAINLLQRREATTYVRGGHQCHHSRYRSFDDYFKIAKYYYPNATLKEMAEGVLSLNNEKECLIIRYCPTIKKTNTTGQIMSRVYQSEPTNYYLKLGFTNTFKFSQMLNM